MTRSEAVPRKRQLREQARRLRAAWASDSLGRARDQAALQRALLASQLWQRAGVVLCYLPFGDEVAPLPLSQSAAGVVSALANPAPRLVSTRIDPESNTLMLHELSGPLQRHPYGFWEPSADAPRVAAREVDLALVPGLAFDLRGGRLGYGGGYYDQLLPLLPANAARIGVTLEALLFAELPNEEHDTRVSHLLTPSGLREARA
jgi:5-formyltetrahydrofolate cyclo-ligase